MQTVDIEVNYDFICPWCWIGQRNLAAALADSGLAHAVSIRYVPFELNPSMPVAGMDRRAYRSRKFGSWAHSQAMDAQVAAAGLTAGAHFDYSRVLLTPNTRLAHRLMQFAQDRDQPNTTAALYEAIYRAYFSKDATSARSTRLLQLPPRIPSTNRRCARICCRTQAKRRSTLRALGPTNSAYRQCRPP